MNTDFFDLCGQIYADFSTPLSPSCEEGSLSHSQALALTIRARDVAGGAIALPEFWSASGACAFVLKSSFNSLYDPFGSPCRGQKPSLPLRKAPPLTPALFNGLYTPFGSPVCGGQKPQERGRKPPSGAQNRYALRLADHQRSPPNCAGWDRMGGTLKGKRVKK